VQTITDSQPTKKPSHKKKAAPINWDKWNPFQRATGEALKQLNKRQKHTSDTDWEEALL
jgi:hypothetical protein